MITRDHEYELRIFIALCEAGWKGSPCWHVVDWMHYKLQLRHPLLRREWLIRYEPTS